jgi:nucleoside-diphosphate-sugar epimerase
MRVFVTGASGHIGSALVPELLGAGHRVVGLARSEASADKLTAAGAEVRRGSLDDLETLTEAAADSDAVIHLAFRHDLVYSEDMAGAAAADLAVIDALGTALEGTGKAFVGVGGTLMLAMAGINDRPGTEEDTVPAGFRVDSENNVIDLATRGVRSAIVRLAPVVHSELDGQGFIPALIGMARTHGNVAYIADGANRWPAVNTYDAAVLFRLAARSPPRQAAGCTASPRRASRSRRSPRPWPASSNSPR